MSNLTRVSIFGAMLLFALSGSVDARTAGEKKSGFGIVKGVVRDVKGNPITGAMVSVVQSGTLEILKQLKSASDGSFLARLTPGKYTLIAAAKGYESQSYTSEVAKSSELVYKFRLQAVGAGKTLPERRTDRNGSMWVIRGTQIRRSIYQVREDETAVTANGDDSDEQESLKSTNADRTESVVESYYGIRSGIGFTGFNFATFRPVSDKLELVFVGQAGTGPAPMRAEAEFRYRPNEAHRVKMAASLTQFSRQGSREMSDLGQFSVRVTDELRLNSRAIIVLGLDYSKFVGSGNDFVLSPRIGFQLETDSKTRIRGSFTTETEERNWETAAEFEGGRIFFREPIAIEDVYVSHGRPLIARSSRLEFGIERVLDNRSTIDSNVFVDLSVNRGIGLANVPIVFLSETEGGVFADQEGRTLGVRVVYSRRINGRFSTAAGYAFGRGQSLNSNPSSPADVFEDNGFQTLFGQFSADMGSGTSIKTVFRLSSEAAIFAIDPFQGRLAIYDPSLSVRFTKALPSMGLPIRAEAVIDARNLFAFQTRAEGEEGAIMLTSQKRVLKGGIKVRF